MIKDKLKKKKKFNNKLLLTRLNIEIYEMKQSK